MAIGLFRRLFVQKENAVEAVGAVVTDLGSDWLLEWGSLGGSVEIPEDIANARVLLVGGGAGGGHGTTGSPGGGGAGGAVVDETFALDKDFYDVAAGRGGMGSSLAAFGAELSTTRDRGQPTEAFGFTALGGSRGAAGDNNLGAGCGGGAGSNASTTVRTGASSTQFSTFGYGFGNSGGNSHPDTIDSGNRAGGGGGGAGTAGGNASSGQGGNGGDGYESNITGTNVYYGGGGGGFGATGGTGGLGGGGNAASGLTLDNYGQPGVNGLGGGGGGGVGTESGVMLNIEGGDGTIKLRIPKSPRYIIQNTTPTITVTGGTVTDLGNNGEKLITFTALTGTSIEFSHPAKGIRAMLVAAGGRGRAGGASQAGGGGGGGGVWRSPPEGLSVAAGTYAIQVGEGVSGGTGVGQDTLAFGVTAIRGGIGNQGNAWSGGSGGGGGSNDNTITRIGGTAQQPTSVDGGLGENGGNGLPSSTINNRAGGGGGGAATAGSNAVSSPLGSSGGNGGNGAFSWIRSTFEFFAGGGGGGGRTARGLGGRGGGGNGANTANLSTVGEDGRGGGGGGGCPNVATQADRRGGHGIVILRINTTGWNIVEN
jgi:hypothetical protein